MLERDDTVEKLNDLIHLDMDAVKAYDEGIRKLDDPADRSTLGGFRDDHRRHVADLQTAVADLGGTPDEAEGDIRGFFIEGMTALRSAISPEQAFQAMRQNEAMTVARYKEASEWETPHVIHSLLVANHGDEHRHLAWIEDRLSVTSGAARRT